MKEKRQSLQTVLGLANKPCCWEVTDRGHRSGGTIRPVRFRGVRRRSWGALCQYPTTYSSSRPPHTCTHCRVWMQWAGILGLEISFLSLRLCCLQRTLQTAPALWGLGLSSMLLLGASLPNLSS